MSSAHEPPGLPEVHDEAGDSPAWLPRVGIAILIAAGAWIATASSGPEAKPETADEAEAAEAEAPAEEPAAGTVQPSEPAQRLPGAAEREAPQQR